MTHDQLTSFLASRDFPCPSCNYNLRGVASDHCPECNTPLTLTLNASATIRAERRLVTILASIIAILSALNIGRACIIISASAQNLYIQPTIMVKPGQSATVTVQGGGGYGNYNWSAVSQREWLSLGWSLMCFALAAWAILWILTHRRVNPTHTTALITAAATSLFVLYHIAYFFIWELR
jgi:hypothetical protein